MWHKTYLIKSAFNPWQLSPALGVANGLGNALAPAVKPAKIGSPESDAAMQQFRGNVLTTGNPTEAQKQTRESLSKGITTQPWLKPSVASQTANRGAGPFVPQLRPQSGRPSNAMGHTMRPMTNSQGPLDWATPQNLAKK